LGYFSGIGAASRHGILFKGANYLELMTKITHIAFDKTGTLTKGIFAVKKVESAFLPENEFVKIVAAVEKHSNHPIAKAIVEYANTCHSRKGGNLPQFEAIAGQARNDIQTQEISGHGISAIIDNKKILVGNGKLMQKFDILYPQEIDNIVETTVLVAINGEFAGYIIIADEIKNDAAHAISLLKNSAKIKTILLSGDKNTIARQTAENLQIDEVFGELLPENKVEILDKIKSDSKNIVAFVGDGINDAPALALSDVGIAMGGLGSQAAIEIADVVIQTDEPSRIFTAINISKSTHKIVIQNIVLAISVKILVMLISVIIPNAQDVHLMWAAVFADVGVALLAILNSMRLIFKKF
jgi:Cd2+/Zn2+-exporting ATPase